MHFAAAQEERVSGAGLRACLAGCIALSLAARAHAEDTRRPGLNWVRLDGADSCLSAAELAARVEARIGRVLFSTPGEAEVFVDGRVRRDGSGWQVTLEVSEPEGRVLGRREMRFEGAACSVIDEGVALVIAVTLYPNTALTEGGVPLGRGTAGSLDSLFGQEPVDPDPNALGAGAAGGARALPAQALEPVRATAPAASSAPPTPRAEPWHVAVDAAATAGFGQLPGASLGLALHLMITPPGAWPIELGATAFLPRGARARAGVEGEARFELAAGSITTCPWQLPWWRAISLCLGAEFGRLHVEPSGFAELQPVSNDLVAGILGAGVLRAMLVSGLYLRGALVLALPLVQRGYAYQTPEGTSAQLYRMPQVAARAEIGLGWLL
jgi:hypothetical protein